MFVWDLSPRQYLPGYDLHCQVFTLISEKSQKLRCDIFYFRCHAIMLCKDLLKITNQAKNDNSVTNDKSITPIWKM